MLNRISRPESRGIPRSPSELTLSIVPSSRLATFSCFDGVVNWMRSPFENSRSTSRCIDTPVSRLREWHKETPYAKPTDFVFASPRRYGRVPICASVFCRVHLRPAAKKAGAAIPDGYRWGLHNLRHSLSNWLVNKAKENPKTAQGILGHSRVQTTLDLYTDEDLDEMNAAQEKYLDAVGFEARGIQ
jgi:integrase